MSDLIPRDAAMDVIKTWGRQINENARMALLLRDMQALEPVDAAPVVHGYWAHLSGDEWCCTACGNVIHTEGSWEHPLVVGKKYCENCGARMDGDSSA